MGDSRSVFRLLTGKIPLGRLRWEDNIRIDLKEIGCNERRETIVLHNFPTACAYYQMEWAGVTNRLKNLVPMLLQVDDVTHQDQP
uniref:(California timema) hypothetical protein n=1 Tax=Timema californicum TaxID=61474 RepID=A0A7R9JGY7_TIMCA|nr:unnamed protein product [Timema californicum]